jgi:hypothetical protein
MMLKPELCQIWDEPMKLARQDLHGYRVSAFYIRRRGYPLNVSIERCESPSIANILMVLSEEQVARRFP